MSPDPDEGFRATDRRRREDREPAPSDAVYGASPAAGDAALLGAPGAQPSLRGLFMMLATEAVVALGDVQDPATGERRRDAAAAAEAIDLLLLLRQKTEGNRTPEETNVLDELLYDLQLRYVRATKSAG
jgi:hypothetical protein